MKIQTVIEWAIGIFASLAGAIGIFFTVRGAYILYLKEISVGKSALKKRDQIIESLEEKIRELTLKSERHGDQIKLLQRDSDDHYNDMEKLDDKIEAINKELKNKTI